MNKMTDKQKKFADEYIRTGNRPESYKFAYPNVKNDNTANAAASRLLKNVNVKAYIDEHMKKHELDAILSQQEALELLKKMAYGEITDKQPIFVGEGIQELVEVPAPTNVRLRAIESMLKRYDAAGRDGLLNKKLELEIQKLEKELQSEETTEDKLSQLIDSVDKQAGDE